MPEDLHLRADAFNPPPPQIEMIQRDDDQRLDDYFISDQF
jgi:hypothetical protein